MRTIALIFIPFLGVALGKTEAFAGQKELLQLTSLGPGKNYRAKMAKQYFGGKGSRCHKWNRFCGR